MGALYLALYPGVPAHQLQHNLGTVRHRLAVVGEARKPYDNSRGAAGLKVVLLCVGQRQILAPLFERCCSALEQLSFDLAVMVAHARRFAADDLQHQPFGRSVKGSRIVRG